MAASRLPQPQLAALVMLSSLAAASAFAPTAIGGPQASAVALARRVGCARLQAEEEVPSAAPSESPSAAPSWYDDVEEQVQSDLATTDPPEPLVPEGPRREPLTEQDLLNTKWKVVATPRPDGWLGGPVREQEFTLLDDATVVWGGSTGGFGTGGRWTLKDGLLEVIRTTPFGLVTGRDYYMATAEAGVNDSLQFEIDGIIRSYNVLFPVAVVADFVATRAPGRFVRDVEEEEADE